METMSITGVSRAQPGDRRCVAYVGEGERGREGRGGGQAQKEAVKNELFLLCTLALSLHPHLCCRKRRWRRRREGGGFIEKPHRMSYGRRREKGRGMEKGSGMDRMRRRLLASSSPFPLRTYVNQGPEARSVLRFITIYRWCRQCLCAAAHSGSSLNNLWVLPLCPTRTMTGSEARCP